MWSSPRVCLRMGLESYRALGTIGSRFGIRSQARPCLRTLENVASVCESPYGRLIAAGSVDMTIKVWLISSGSLLRILHGHTDWVSSVCMSSDGSRIISGSRDKTIKVWNVTSGACLCTLGGHIGEVTSVCMSPDGSKIISGSDDRTIKVWNMVFCSLCVYFISGSGDRTIKVWSKID